MQQATVLDGMRAALHWLVKGTSFPSIE